MYGAPDDTSCVSFSGSASMLTFTDSDIARDSRHVHWESVPWMPDTASPSPPSQSKDTLIEPASSSSSYKSKKGFGNVKAKMKAVARFLSNTKDRQEPAPAVKVEASGVPIAGQLPPPTIVSDAKGVYVDQQRRTTHDDASRAARRDAMEQNKEQRRTFCESRQAIETLRERLESEEGISKPPPPPPPPRPPTPAMPPPAALAKRRYPNGPESGIGFPRPEHPRSRSGTPHPAVSPAVRIASRPLPPTPACPSPPHHTNTPPAHPQPQTQLAQTLGLSTTVDKILQPSSTFNDLSVNTRIDTSLFPQLERFPSLRRAHNINNYSQLDADRLAEEPETLASFKSERSHRKASSAFSAASTTQIMDLSREAVCHMPRYDEPAVRSNLQQQPQGRWQVTRKPVPTQVSSRKSSLFVEPSVDSEAAHRIQEWRVRIQSTPSVVSSKVASAYSRFPMENDDGVSSHLTSVSRSPLSKDNRSEKSRREKEAECDPEKTPTLQAKRVTNLGHAKALSYKSSPDKLSANGRSIRGGDKSHDTASRQSRVYSSKNNMGTSHIARLSDSQFERLALATEAASPPPPPPPSIPREDSLIAATACSQHLLHPQPPAVSENTQDDERRSSLDATGTTLSVLEQKASSHIDTLDNMIRRHPDKMFEVFKKRPGLMLVILLRSKVEDRLSEVNASKIQKLEEEEKVEMVDLAPATSGRSKEEKQCLDLLEESLIDLHFDDEDPREKSSNNKEEEGKEAAELASLVMSNHAPVIGEYIQEVPDIVVSHHTGSVGLGFRSPIPSPSYLYDELEHGQDRNQEDRLEAAAGVVAELGARSERALREMVHHLEQAGELCSMQHILASLQDRLMSTRDDCGRLNERLSTLEQVVFSPTPGLTPDTTLGNTASTFPRLQPMTPPHQ